MNDIIDNQYHRDCFFDSGNENWDWQNLSKKSHNNITNRKKLNINKCDCCGEIWNNDNLIKFNIGKYGLYICPDCLEDMTNGNMLKAIFPNIQTRNENTDFITYSLDGIVGTCVEAKWWNAPYERS